MRQTAVAGAAAADLGPEFRLDPFALPVRQISSPESPAFTLDRKRAVVRRLLGGHLATLTVPVSAYAGVSVRIEPVGTAGDIRVVVELMHDDPALTLPLVVASAPEDAAADWIAWGRALNLPLLVVESDGTVRMPVKRMGGLTVAKAAPRRNRAVFTGRRSRYIRRRKPGRPGGPDVLIGPRNHRPGLIPAKALEQLGVVGADAGELPVAAGALAGFAAIAADAAQIVHRCREAAADAARALFGRRRDQRTIRTGAADSPTTWRGRRRRATYRRWSGAWLPNPTDRRCRSPRR